MRLRLCARLSRTGGSAGSSVAHHRGHVGFGDDLTVDFPYAAHLANGSPQLDDLELEPYLVSRFYRPAEFHVVQRHEVDNLALRIFNRSHQQHASDLRHRLDDQHARHDRVAWEMSLEKRLVDGDVLEPYYALFFLDLEDPVHQQERIAVWQHLHDVFDRIHPLLLSAGFHHLTNQRHRPPMTRLYCYDSRPDSRAGEGEVADAVHRLVSYKFVAPAKLTTKNIA